jgi:hypothetical protein
MPTLTDPIILALIRSALANWNVTGYVKWVDLPLAWLKRNLAPLGVREVNHLIWEHVRQGGVIDQVRETRPEWNDRGYHYDFRLSIGGRAIYIETRLHDDDPDDPTLEVVNIHDV